MTTRPVASVRKFFESHFPERQLYHRSRGSVQFVTLSAPAQIGLLIISLAFFGWVAYASVNMVFRDEIIAAKEQHFATMQAAYEGRIADMQKDYDALNSALAITQARFTSAASELETRHRQLSDVLSRHEAALEDLGELKSRVNTAYRALDTATGGNRVIMSGDNGPTARRRVAREEPDFVGGSFAPVSAAVTNGRVSVLGADTGKDMPRPFAEMSRGLDGRLTTLDAAQRAMITQLDAAAQEATRSLEKIMAITGLNVDRVLERVAEDFANQPTRNSDWEPESAEGLGGPFVPLQAIGSNRHGMRSPNEPDADIRALQASVERLVGLESALSVIPLVLPLNAEHHYASGFGRRLDPFRGTQAFHYGLDIVADYKTPVLAPSAGRVTHASRQGPYGNMVEIDHGHGVRTRYGHLYRIDVKVGEYVKFQQRLGLLGSTGRSTGPHLHYEVRFNGTLRDPARFLEAGRYVFQG